MVEKNFPNLLFYKNLHKKGAQSPFFIINKSKLQSKLNAKHDVVP